MGSLLPFGNNMALLNTKQIQIKPISLVSSRQDSLSFFTFKQNKNTTQNFLISLRKDSIFLHFFLFFVFLHLLSFSVFSLSVFFFLFSSPYTTGTRSQLFSLLNLGGLLYIGIDAQMSHISPDCPYGSSA